MSKKPETLFSNQLIKNLNQVFFTRIENKHGGGIPDLYGTYNNKSAFLELKIKTKQNNVLISPLQISWNYKHFISSPRNFYIVESLEARSFKLYEGNKGKELLSSGYLAPCIMELGFNEKDFLKLDNFLKFL